MKLFDKKRFLPLGLVSMMLLFMAPVSAQNNSEDLTVVKGFVTDAALGTPMAGVRVQAYNLSRFSTMTREDGSFSIRIPDYVSSLTFSLEGCNTNVVALKGRTEDIQVKMYDDNFSEFYRTSNTSLSVSEAGVSSVNADLMIDGQMQRSLQGSILSVMRSGQLGMGALMQVDGICRSIKWNTSE